MGLWETIAEAIGGASGKPFSLERHSSVGGGDINRAYRISGEGASYFVKLNRADRLDMFEAEADGLRELAAAEAIRVPQPLVSGTAGSDAFLVMEELPLGGSGSSAELGERLARLHQHTADRFGWYRDNTIGSTEQPNRYHDDWIAFWREERLGFQLRLAARHGGNLQRLGEELLERLPGLFAGYTPQPSLLHGDLWGGNYAFARSGEPVIFDPAVYYGDREADIAMTELFGGFGGDFYRAYEAVAPLDSGYAVRKRLYNLYHILNHYHMFGGGYGSQAEGMIQRLLSELR